MGALGSGWGLGKGGLWFQGCSSTAPRRPQTPVEAEEETVPDTTEPPSPVRGLVGREPVWEPWGVVGRAMSV